MESNQTGRSTPIALGTQRANPKSDQKTGTLFIQIKPKKKQNT